MQKASIKAKLLPAVAMLAVSAVVLTTASYAWFTMSKQVELTGINLTATTPDSLEISLGKAPESSATDLVAPNEGVPTDWSNKVQYQSVYAQTGRLVPASTVDGIKLFHTDLVQKGTDGSLLDGQALKKNETEYAFTAVDKTKDYVKTSFTSEPALTEENGKGYYLDIPVWIRTRGATGANLALKVDVKPSTTITDASSDADKAQFAKEEKLLKSLRLALLTKETTGEGDQAKTTEAGTAEKYMWLNGATYFNDGAASNETQLGKTYTDKQIVPVTTTDGNGLAPAGCSQVLQVAGADLSKGEQYGAAKQFYVRLWLEGQDQNCIDDNAGMSFNLDLAFIKCAS